MCGIAGFVDYKKKSNQAILKEMVGTLRHRGPDDNGFNIWKESKYQLGFCQSRLSIIDLSEGGHQPMHYQHLSTVFNGEIYNYQEIKTELIKQYNHTFETESDTEVILHAYAQWGEKAVEKFIGMFAIVLYDRKNKELILIRDRAGVKPLFYYWDGQLFLFSSELKAFHKHPRFRKKIDKSALKSYMTYGYIPSPQCIFEGAHKLNPGTIQKVRLAQKKIEHNTYWKIEDCYKKDKLDISYPDAKEELQSLLTNAFEYRMVADVPVGVFLSGGYDSTIVTALLQKNRTDKLKTFTIGFEEGNNEAPYARKTAKYLGTDHTEYICTTKEAQEIIPDLPYYYDEPFGDSSAIPTTLVSRIAKRDVTVALSADAGDEIFAGYNRYQKILDYHTHLNKIPDFLKPIAKMGFETAYTLLPDYYSGLKYKLAGVKNGLHRDHTKQALQLFIQLMQTPYFLVEHCINNDENERDNFNMSGLDNYKETIDPILALDYKLYLQNDILTKVDRATMSVSLEGRDPLVDHRIVEFAAQLPSSFKIVNGDKKKILKDILHEHVPKKMMDRPKSGFSLPIYSWLKNDLAYLIDEYLNKNSLAESGCWNVKYCHRQVKKFKSGKFHYSPFIWYLLMFQMWYKRWMT